MYITLESDYAIRIVSCLCENKCRIDAKTISEKTCVTLRFALKILRKLVSAGIVKSYKGAQGGYEIAKKPSEISINDVLKVIEGEYRLSRCLCDEHTCSRGKSGCCEYQNAFKEISDIVTEKLENYTFENINKRSRQQ